MTIPNINDLELSPSLARTILISYASVITGFIFVCIYNNATNSTG